MTGFASGTGTHAPYTWGWELRSVNGKGQDLRLRVPDWVDGLEAALRTMLAKSAARGNITLSLRIARDETLGAVQVNAAQLASVLSALSEIEAHAMDAGVSLAPSRASDIVALRGVLEQSTSEEDTAELTQALTAAFPELLDAFNAMRTSEGAALEKLLQAQLAEVAALTQTAVQQAEARKDDMAATLRRNLTRVLDNTEGVDPDRLAQELAMIAVKTDITEEIDRLSAHVTAAQDLIAVGGPVGRKLDFLMQEFNREANTLCAKAQSTDLTRTGLALKAVIDQMREQVQNVE
jgi:uncharacterized protein (TIGR00255 family)